MAGEVLLTGGDALTLMQPPPNNDKGQNSARDVRKLLFQGLLLGPGAGGFTRRGIVHRGWISGGVPQEGLVQERLSPGQGVRINASIAVIPRGSISGQDQGPYVGGVNGQFDIDFPLPAAPTSNSRYDAIFQRIVDRNITEDAAEVLHGEYYAHRSGATAAVLNIDGTPDAAGAPPSTPDGYLPIAFIARATNDNTISNAEITDVRRGTSLAGTPRVLFPWDVAKIASDTGYMLGEERWRPAGAVYPSFLDYWDGTEWRGTRGHSFAEPAQTSPNTLASGGTAALAAGVVIPWPGWKYRIELDAEIEWSSTFSSGNSRTMVLEARLDTDTYVDTTGAGTAASPRTYVGPPANLFGVPGGIIGFERAVAPSGGIHHAHLHVPASQSPTVDDGASHTLYVRIQNKDDTSTFTLIRGVPYGFQVRIVPA